jgi:hypothetical protein
VTQHASCGVGARCWWVVVGASDVLHVVAGGGGSFGVGVRCTEVVVGAGDVLRVWGGGGDVVVVLVVVVGGHVGGELNATESRSTPITTVHIHCLLSLNISR